MLSRILKDIKENPHNHLLLIISFVSGVLGLCSWQYGKGYYSTLGIPISYSHIDNLIFVFDQMTKISFIKTSEFKWPSWFTIGGSFLMLLIWVSRKIYDVGKVKGWFTLVELTEKEELSFSSAQWIVVAGVTSYLMGISADTVLGQLAIFLFVGWVFKIFIVQIWNVKFTSMKFYKPLLIFIGLYIFVGFFYIAGVFDAKRIVSSKFSKLASACLSAPLKGGEPKDDGFIACGKLVHIDSNRVCLKEDADYPICRQREGYDITVIPN